MERRGQCDGLRNGPIATISNPGARKFRRLRRPVKASPAHIHPRKKESMQAWGRNAN